MLTITDTGSEYSYTSLPVSSSPTTVGLENQISRLFRSRLRIAAHRLGNAAERNHIANDEVLDTLISTIYTILIVRSFTLCATLVVHAFSNFNLKKTVPGRYIFVGRTVRIYRPDNLLTRLSEQQSQEFIFVCVINAEHDFQLLKFFFHRSALTHLTLT
uniref:Uncharacterized protein n=1 Tax=virus sp. ctqEG8 TaxID=2827998 RepID=A0A8S5RFL6_9VIRU|nr:MAG TPA: hypothetical protein [virus sp. ctqEG8]